jgi:hypothetical protein
MGECPVCKSQNQDDAVMCVNCGERLRKKPEVLSWVVICLMIAVVFGASYVLTLKRDASIALRDADDVRVNTARVVQGDDCCSTDDSECRHQTENGNPHDCKNAYGTRYVGGAVK